MEKPKPVMESIDISAVKEALTSVNGIISADVQLDGVKIKAVHLLTTIDGKAAVKAARTAIYVKTGYLLEKGTVFKVARIS
jgi:copper chaperone CopZ